MDAIVLGFQNIFSDPTALVLLVFGIFFGIVFGAIPGLTATLGVTLMIPFTFVLSPIQGLVFLVAIYVGGISGGLITATLINIPGTPSSIFTTLDGYPMAKDGKAGQALSIGVFASLIGGTFSALALFLIAPQLAKVSLYFGNWEYFALALMGLAIVVSMTSDNLLKGLIGAILGLLLASVGMDTVTGASRLTFDFWQLQGGISVTAVMMGLFAVREIFLQSRDLSKTKNKINPGKMSFKPPIKEMKDCGKSLAAGTLFGTGIGILPGIGQNCSTLIAYNQAKTMSKHPEKFGKGSPEGICASESSNNATNGGALIPLVTLGIPGDMTTAALIGGLMIHGLQPGPLLFTENVDVVGAIMVSYFLANIIMYIMELGLMSVFVRMINIKFSYLFPIIITSCILGVFALNNRIFDVWILVIFGVAGYILDQLGVDMTPIILGFILGPLVEKYMRTALIGSNGSFAEMFTRPAATLFFIIAILFLIIPTITRIRNKKKRNAKFA